VTADDVKRKINDSLRRVREASGQSIPAFAKRSGLSVEHIAQIEDPSYGGTNIDVLCAYAEGLDIPFDLLAETLTEQFDLLRKAFESRRNRK